MTYAIEGLHAGARQWAFLVVPGFAAVRGAR